MSSPGGRTGFIVQRKYAKIRIYRYIIYIYKHSYIHIWDSQEGIVEGMNQAKLANFGSYMVMKSDRPRRFWPSSLKEREREAENLSLLCDGIQ